MSTLFPSNVDDCDSFVNGFGFVGHERDVGLGAEQSTGVNPEQLLPAKGDHNIIPLCQRILVALISEEDCTGGNGDIKFDAYEAKFEQDGELELNSLDHHSRANNQFACHSAYNGYTESDVVSNPTNGLGSSFGNFEYGLLEDKTLRPSLTCSESQYDSLNMNDKLLLELQSIGIFLEPVVSLHL